MSGKDTAERARQAALALFARHGYSAVSMRDIAGEVGVGAPALYNHFATKQDLLAELMEAHLRDLLAAWRAHPMAAESVDPQAALEAFGRFHMRFHQDKTDEVFVAYMELRSLDRPNFHRIERMRGEYERFLSDLIERGAALGVFHAPEPKIAAMAIIAMLTGVTNWYRSGGRLSSRAVEDLYIDMIRRTLRPGGGDD